MGLAQGFLLLVDLEDDSGLTPGAGKRIITRMIARQNIEVAALSRRQRRVLVSAMLLLLPAVVLAGAWRLGGVSALEDDLLYYLPIRQYIGERMAAGDWPLWNPLVGMGTSLAADPQSGLWYPPTLLFAVLPPLTAYPVSIVLHFALAGAGMYRFLRASHRSWSAAFLGAVAFEFCGYLVAHRAHLTIHHAAAWLPWILYGWRRFADTGRYRHFALASAAFGLQMLVQHTQVSILTAIIVTAYVAVVLWPARKSLWWQYPLGMTLGAALAAVQTLPTFYHFAASGRGLPTYYLFTENSWVPTSAVLMLFPMLFGARTPGVWADPWWGISHFCEQSAYASITILMLAIASLALIRRCVGKTGGAAKPVLKAAWNREVLFWWAASAAALIISLGDATPASKWLFHLPIYRSLRVPARWLLVWSTAMPILAAATVDVLRQDGPAADAVRRWVRNIATRVIPVIAALILIALLIARWQMPALQKAFGDRWGAVAIFTGLERAARWTNPAIWWPLVMIAVSAWVVLTFARSTGRRRLTAVFIVMLVDLASVAAFVDVDASTYARSDLIEPPPLVAAIQKQNPRPGDRLLVPRYQADYRRPLEVLWPQTNMRWHVPTSNAYGPFWPLASRQLLRFMPWGSSEAMLELLRNVPLCRALGVRFIAVRTPVEREILTAATADALPEPVRMPITGAQAMEPVRFGEDLRWPVRIDTPGIYELTFDAEPVYGSPSQWHLRLETASAEEIDWTRRLEPADLAAGPRRLRFLFVCPDVEAEAFVRVKAEMRHALNAGRATFGRVAQWPPARDLDTAGVPFLFLADLPGEVSFYELPAGNDLVWVVDKVVPVPDLASAVTMLQGKAAEIGLPETVVLEWPAEKPLPATSVVDCTYERFRPEHIRIRVKPTTGCALVFNETYDPGWSATTAGDRPIPIRRANAVCQGLVVPPGVAEVHLRFRPVGLTAGIGISLGAALVLLAGIFATRRDP